MSLPAHPPGHSVAVDSHAHFHDLGNLDGLFDRVRAALRGCLGRQWQPALLVLTEPASRPTFARLRELASAGQRPGAAGLWRIETTDEPISLAARHRDGDTLHLLAGQQLVTAENLEVLSLLALPGIADGLPLAETVRRVRQHGGLPVLPWGVGKWLGGRGTLISEFLDEPREGPLFLGDNGGRPAVWYSVPQFRQALDRGIPILRGSDPLRCSYLRRPAGSCGTVLRCPLETERPGRSLREALETAAPPIAAFGRPETPWNFIRDQISLRLG